MTSGGLWVAYDSVIASRCDVWGLFRGHGTASLRAARMLYRLIRRGRPGVHSALCQLHFTQLLPYTPLHTIATTNMRRR
jgi:hypothetical protein